MPRAACVGGGPAKWEKKENITRQKPERKPSTDSIASVFAVVPAIPLKGSRESLGVTAMPGWRLDTVCLTSQDYWPVAPVAIGADRAGGDLIPPFPGTSGTGDGFTAIEPGVMIVRPLPLGIAFTGAV